MSMEIIELYTNKENFGFTDETNIALGNMFTAILNTMDLIKVVQMLDGKVLFGITDRHSKIVTNLDLDVDQVSNAYDITGVSGKICIVAGAGTSIRNDMKLDQQKFEQVINIVALIAKYLDMKKIQYSQSHKTKATNMILTTE